MNSISLQKIKNAYSNKGYVYFTGIKPYNLNLWGIRKQFGDVNLFDDYLGISFFDENGVEKIFCNKATVDPGKYYLLTKLGNPNGTFILAPGQYRSCWQTGLHGKTKYPALVQKSGYHGFKGWRDDLLNGVLERKLDANGDFFTDVLGLNMHRSKSTYADLVSEYSAGCQVRKVNNSHLMIMEIIQKSLTFYPDSFSYTLFDEEDVFGTPSGVRTTKGVIVQKKWPDDYIKVVK